MDKLLMTLGIAAMLIGIGFGITELISLQPKEDFTWVLFSGPLEGLC